jgi:hypothetical protein
VILIVAAVPEAEVVVLMKILGVLGFDVCLLGLVQAEG